MENLTKRAAISMHKEMWIWIAEEIARNKCVMVIEYLKVEFCIASNANPKNLCFCCEYASQEDWLGVVYCSKCPVVWRNNVSARCYMAEYSRITRFAGLTAEERYIEKNWKKQAKLAYKIAMLPERKEENGGK